MSKPTTVPAFDTGNVNTSAPVAGLLSSGYANNAVPTAQNLNWLFYWIGLWLTWLNGLWDGSGNLTLDNNANLTFSGTGHVIRGTMEKRIHGAMWVPVGSGAYTFDATSGSVKTGANTNVFRLGIPIQSDETLTSVILDYSQGNLDVITFKAFQYDTFGNTQTQLGTTQTSSGFTTDAQLSITGLSAAANSGTPTPRVFWCEVACTTMSAGAVLKFVKFTTTIPT